MSDDFLDHLHDLFSAFAPIRTRAMFGGHGIYRDDLIIGLVLDDALYLKTDADTVGHFEAAGCTPFVYHGQEKPITTSYWSLPEEAMDSSQAMLPWARLAFEAALRKPRSRKPKPRTSKR